MMQVGLIRLEIMGAPVSMTIFKDGQGLIARNQTPDKAHPRVAAGTMVAAPAGGAAEEVVMVASGLIEPPSGPIITILPRLEMHQGAVVWPVQTVQASYEGITG